LGSSIGGKMALKFITFVYEDPDDNIVLNVDRINFCKITSNLMKISFGMQDLIILKGDYTEEGIEFSMNVIRMETKKWEGLKESLIRIGLLGKM
jgi:hypothetical protein